MKFTADPAAVITVTFGDKTFRCGQRTYAHLLATQDALTIARPGALLHVIQPCYNTGVAMSAGTHDRDAVLDVSIPQMTWIDAQHFLRAQGWAAWWRHTGSWAPERLWHIHMISLGAPAAGCPVGTLIPAQITDYFNHALGLANQHTPGDDSTWHPTSIDSTVFDYAAWLKEYDMPYTDWPEKDQAALVKDVAAAVRDSILNADMNAQEPEGSTDFKGVSLRQAIKAIYRRTASK